MFTTEWIQTQVSQGEYLFSRHGDRERQNDNLSISEIESEIEEALFHGRILEHYPNTGRGENCLVAGFTKQGKPIHVVCGQLKQKLTIITVYIPSPPKFKNPYERG